MTPPQNQKTNGITTILFYTEPPQFFPHKGQWLDVKEEIEGFQLGVPLPEEEPVESVVLAATEQWILFYIANNEIERVGETDGRIEQLQQKKVRLRRVGLQTRRVRGSAKYSSQAGRS
jgi:hypothetical protein